MGAFVERQYKSILATAMLKWVNVKDDAEASRIAEEFYAGLIERRIRRFFRNYQLIVKDKKETDQVHEDVNHYFAMHKARRCFEAFRLGCELSKIKREQYL
jgi:hypothetical protein